MRLNRLAACRSLSVWALFMLLGAAEAPCQLRPENYFQGQLDRSQVMRAAASVSPQEYPNADVACIDQHYWVEYKPDGTSVQWDEKYVKILSAKGKRQYSRISSFFMAQYKSTEILWVEILKPDGADRVIDLDQHSTIAVDHGQMGSNSYDPRQKLLTVNIPHLQVGDTLHYIIKDTYFDARVPNTWSQQIHFESSHPIVRKEVTICAPPKNDLKRIAIRSAIPGALAHARHIGQDHIIYNWIANDVPMALPERNMPPLHTQTQRLLVSTIDGWASISRWYWHLAEPQIRLISPQMAQTVLDITSRLNAPKAQMEAIFKWVSQEIRYLGLTVEKTSPGYEPHPARMTFERRAGVCRDKAALLTAMLRIAGFDAYPTLIRTDHKMDQEVPQPFFNHVITAVRNADGSFVLMDATDETSRFLLPAYLNDKSYLIATPEGESLRTTPIESADNHMLLIHTTGELDTSGHLSARTQIVFNGINDNLYRDLLAGKSYAEMKAYFEVVVNKYAFCAQIEDFEITPRDLMDTRVPLSIKFSIESDVMETIKDGTALIKPPFIGHNLGWVHFLTGRFGLASRKYALITGDACGIRENFQIKLSKDLASQVILPEFATIDDVGTTWHKQIALDGNVLVGEKTFKLKRSEYTPDQYIALRKNLSEMEYHRRKYLIVHKPDPAKGVDEWLQGLNADALVLNEVNDYEIEDRHHWTESNYLKLKILTYAGKKRYSDLIVDFNPIWESVDIAFARVITRSGKIIDINADEINIMDARWVDAAPRYAPEKLLVLNFPGVEIGSIIEFKIIKSKTNHPFFTIDGSLHGSGNPFYKKSGKFRYHEPILHKTLKIKYPHNLDLKIDKYEFGTEDLYRAGANDAPPIREHRSQAGDTKIVEFTAAMVPPVAREDALPPWYSFNPTVLASSTDLSRYARYMVAQLMEKAAVSPIIQSASTAIVGDQNCPQDKIQAIRDFTDRTIAHIAIPYGKIPAANISAADITLREGYGHTIDHAVLLFALLKAAGFNPEFILSTNTSPLKVLWQPLVATPSYNWFDAILVRVKTASGYIYLNDTNQYAMLGATASHQYPGLVLETAQIDIIESLSEEYDDKRISRYDIALNADGSARVKVAHAYYGHEYSLFRKSREALSPEGERRYILDLAASLSQNAVFTGEYAANHATYPGTETYSVRIERFLIDQGGYYYINLPGLYTSVYGAYKNSRMNPFYYDGFDQDYVRVNLDFNALGKRIVLSPPRRAHLRINGTGSIYINAGPITEHAERDHDAVDEGFYVEQQIELSPFLLSPDEYVVARKNHEKMAHPSMNKILFN